MQQSPEWKCVFGEVSAGRRVVFPWQFAVGRLCFLQFERRYRSDVGDNWRRFFLKVHLAAKSSVSKLALAIRREVHCRGNRCLSESRVIHFAVSMLWLSRVRCVLKVWGLL